MLRLFAAVAWVVAPCAGKEASSISSELWYLNEALAARSLHDPFVLSLGSGALPRPAFAAYVAQDAFFLRAFAAAYDAAIGKCGDEPAGVADRCARDLAILRDAVADELELHGSYAKKWGAELDGPGFAPTPATARYVAFLGDVAGSAETSAAAVVAAMAPCMVLYNEIGVALASAGAADASNPYAEWVETYASAAFSGARKTIDDLLDALAAAAEDEDRHDKVGAVPRLYAEALRLEKAFFAAQALSPTHEADNAAFLHRLTGRREL